MTEKNREKFFDGVDYDRFEGIFMPANLKVEKRSEFEEYKEIKKFVMNNVELAIDELIKDLENKDK